MDYRTPSDRGTYFPCGSTSTSRVRSLTAAESKAFQSDAWAFWRARSETLLQQVGARVAIASKLCPPEGVPALESLGRSAESTIVSIWPTDRHVNMSWCKAGCLEQAQAFDRMYEGMADVLGVPVDTVRDYFGEEAAPPELVGTSKSLRVPSPRATADDAPALTKASVDLAS